MKILLALIFSLSVFTSNAADIYWVLGSGNWSDGASHWSTTSGGAPGAAVPAAGDNAIFDNNSGLGIASTVTIDVAVEITNWNFSGVATTFNYDSPAALGFVVHGSIVSNLPGASFSGTWGEIEMNALTTGQTITSGATVWVQDFRITGERISLLDNFSNGTSLFNVDNGGLDLGGNDFITGQFLSALTNNRDIDISGSEIVVNSGVWTIDSTNLTWSFASSNINLGDLLGVAVFTGGGIDYDTLRSTSATETQYFNNNSFSLFEIQTSSQLKIDNNDTLYTDSLVAFGTCAAPSIISTTGPGLSGNISKTGFPNLSLSGISVNSVDAIAPGNYVLSNSTITASAGWTVGGSNFYWVNDSGNWNDGNQWSFTSGGAPSGCIPTFTDTVYFDLNSFSTAGHTVTVDDTAFFERMDWTGINGTQALLLDSSMYSFGDVTFDPNLSVQRNTLVANLIFWDEAQFDPADAAFIDLSISLLADNSTDVVQLLDTLIMSDSSSILLFNGTLNTQNHNILTGTLSSVNNPFSGADLRGLTLGSSEISLLSSFTTQGDTTLNVAAGTSHIIVGDTLGYSNSFTAENKAFYDLTLNFEPLSNIQLVKGNNSFNRFEIIKGSKVHIDSSSTITVADSLLLLGNCQDSIYLLSSDTTDFSQQARINHTGAAGEISSECVNVYGINATGNTINTLFSSDRANNTNWFFDPTAGVTNSFVLSGSFCFGDTVLITNNSTAISGDPNDFTSVWYFNDGSTGYYLNPPTDSTWIDYEPDTTAHVFLEHDSINVVLETTYKNFCTYRDTQRIDIIRPNISVLTTEPDLSVCPWDSVTFEAFSGVPDSIAVTSFEFFYNGVSQNTPSPNDTLFTVYNFQDNDSVAVLAYEGGCVSDTMPQFIYSVYDNPVFNFTSSDADTSICDGDLVSFNAWSNDSLYQHLFLLNGSGVSPFMDSVGYYTNSSLIDNDIVYAVAIDTNNCTDTLSMTFNVDPLPPVVLTESTGGNVICANDIVTFTAAGADNYIFYIDGVPQGVASPVNTLTLNNLQTGDTVTVEGINNNGCSKFAAEFYHYLVTPLPAVLLTSSDADSTICSTESVSFNATGASIYEFFINGSSVQGPSSTVTFNPATLNDNDTVYVEGSFAGCTGTSSSVIMEVFVAPNTTLTSDDPDNTICYGTDVTFTGANATNYEFFVDGVSQGPSSTNSTFSTSTLTDGQTIQVVGESNGCTVSQSLSFNVLLNPNVSLFSDDADNILCDGEPLTLTGANAVNYEYFANGASIQGPSTTSTLTDPTLIIGLNEVVLVGTASNGCTDTSTVMDITVNPNPMVNLASSDIDFIICEGESVLFTGTGADQYEFFVDGISQGGLSSNDTYSTQSLIDGQTISLEGVLNGCQGTASSITFTVNDVPNVNLNSDDLDNSFCENELINFTASGANNYEFIVDGNSQGPSSVSNTLNSSTFTNGSYWVEVIGEANNCIANDSIYVNVFDLPTATLVSDDIDNIICANEVVTYTANGGSLYEFFNNGISLGAPNSVNTVSLNNLGNGDVISVEVTSLNGCPDQETYLAISVNPEPTVSAVSSDPDLEICQGDLVTVTASGATEYEFFLNGTSLGASSPTNSIDLNNLTTGDVVSVIGASAGCSSSGPSLSYTVYGYPIVQLTNLNDTVLCTGELTQLEAFGANNYQFLVNGTAVGPFSANSNLNTPLNSGDIVTVIGESNGCQSTSMDSQSFTVYNYPTINVTTTPSNTICAEDLVTLNASGALSYEFLLNGVTQQSGTASTYNVSDLINGDVIEIIGYNEDCPSPISTETFIVNSMNLSLAVSPSTLVCEGEPVTLTASGGNQYEFSLNGSVVSPLSATNTYSSSTLSDTDLIEVEAYNTATGCTQSFSDIMMNVIDAPTITPLSSTTFCDGDSVILLSNALYGNQWLLNGTAIPNETDTALVVYDSGDYSLEVTAGGDGDVWSFGHNDTGIFGSGDNFDNSEPTDAVLTQNLTSISSGYDFVIGVTAAGEVVAWGDNSAGQLGDGTYTSVNLPQAVPSLSNIRSVATTMESCMAVTNGGDVYVWGDNNSGQLATGNNAVINFPLLNNSLSNTDTISGGLNHFVLLKNDGTVWTMGNNDQGQLGTGNLISSNVAVQVAGLNNIVSVGAGEYTSFAINNSGDLFVWGNNTNGELGLGDLINRTTPEQSNLRNIKQATGGATHSLFVDSNEKLYATGGNGFGQLGLGNTTDSSEPVEVNISGVKTISAGQYTSLARRMDNSVYGFGNNTEDQLSSPNGNAIVTPEHITDLDGVTFMEASQSSSHFIFGESTTCTSQTVNVNVLSSPVVSITVDGDTLIATPGSSYQWYYEGIPIPGATSQIYETLESGSYSVEVTFPSGCVGTSEVIYHSLISVMESEMVGLMIYPNPASDVLNYVSEHSISNVLLLDESGRMVLSKDQSSNSGFLSISDLSNGIYILQITTNDQVVTRRIVKSSF